MAKPLIQFMTEVSGVCCQWYFMEKYKGLTDKETAKRLGVSARTVSETRSMIKNGAFRCRNNPNCQNQK